MFIRFKNVDKKNDVNGKSANVLHIDDIMALSRDDNNPRDENGHSTDRQPDNLGDALVMALMKRGDIKDISEKKLTEDRSQYLMVVLNNGDRIYTGSNFDEAIEKLNGRGLLVDL